MFYIQAKKMMREQFITVGSLRLWCETFGKKGDPALLLIMGTGGQGILWPLEFCKRLSESGFYVIRYDHRDTGLSAQIDYEKDPYTVDDLAHDAVAILDGLKVKKAHIVGASIGASIATFLAIDYPDRVKSVVLMMASREVGHVVNPEETKESHLPKPKAEYLQWVGKYVAALSSGASEDEQVALMIEGGKLCNGSKAPLDEKQYLKLREELLARSSYTKGTGHHLMAAKASLDKIRQAPQKITLPTLIINGSEDPLFSVEHGEDLAKTIPRAKLAIIDGLGHIFNPFFSETIIKLISAHHQNL